MALTIRVTVAAADVEWVSDQLWGLGVLAIEEIVGTGETVILRTSMGEDHDTVRRAMDSLDVTLDWSFELIDDRTVDT